MTIRPNRPTPFSRLRSSITGLADSIADARRMQAEMRKKYPHLHW